MKVDRYLGTTKEQRKMARAVAKDVLGRLNTYKVRRGMYFEANWETAKDIEGKDIKTAKPEVFKSCTVCAKGAMFLSRARIFKEYTFPVSGYGAEHVVCHAVHDDFGWMNSDLIENAFEGRRINDSGHEVRDAIYAAAEKFGKRFRSDRNRLKAIMQNVLDNGGVFRPDKVKKPA